jgi:hypothetical protein
MVTENPRNSVVLEEQTDRQKRAQECAEQDGHGIPVKVRDRCYLIGWSIGVVLALVVAIVLVSGVVPDFAPLSIMVPVLFGSSLAAMQSLL